MERFLARAGVLPLCAPRRLVTMPAGDPTMSRSESPATIHKPRNRRSPEPRASRSSEGSRPALWLVGFAFTVSGVTSLVLEIVWAKALALLLGSTLHAVSTVVATYLAGLALGAYVAGRLAPRAARPLRLYGLLEMGVGAYAVLSLFLIHALDPLAGALYARLGAASPLYLAARVALAAIVLLPPTVLMGATLPTLVSWAARGRTGFGRSLGLLYGLNTLGAVAGASLAGVVFVPQLGLRATTLVIGALALGVGGGMALLGSRDRTRGPTTAAEAEPAKTSTTLGAAHRAWAVVLFGFSGACALVFEITWTRVFALVFGSSVYSFAVVLASYLLALALGSLVLGGRLAESRNPWLAFGLLQAGVGAGAAVGLWLLPELPKLFLSALFARRDNIAVLYVVLAAVTSLVTFLPCLAFGALFPVGARLIAGDGMPGARATGMAYAANTAGTLTGSLVAGFVLLPHWGVHATWVGTSLTSLLLGAAALATVRHAKPALVGGMALLFVALVLANLLSPAWSKALFTLGSFTTAIFLNLDVTRGHDAIADLEHMERNNKVLFYKEGLHAVVSVHEVPGDPPFLGLRVNGKPDASTGRDMATQVFLGHIPMLWAPPAAEVCVIGQGSGVTTRAALEHGPRHVTVVELEPAVLEASHFFDAYSDSVLSDPRVEVVLEDGRQHLQHSGRVYDAIISEPSNPWVAGTNNLFTVDFYRRVHAALRPRGVFCQWIQAYEISPPALGSLFRSFAQVFPEGEVFLVNTDFIVVAPSPGEKVPVSKLMIEDEHGPVPTFLRRYQLQWNGAVAGSHLGSVRALIDQFPEAPLNTDDKPYVEYRAPIDLYQPPTREDPWKYASASPVTDLQRWVRASDVDSVAYAAGLYQCRMARWQRARALAAALRERGGNAEPLADQVEALAAGGERSARVTAIVDEATRAL